MDDDVKLWNDKRERDLYENFADLFATEKLDKAYVRDAISPSEYEVECQNLIAQFKTLGSTLKHIIPSIERFHDTYGMDCPAALNRSLISGIPATVEHRAASAPVVAECVQSFITAMDSLKLNMVAVDQLFIRCCVIFRAHSIGLTFWSLILKVKVKMREWIARLLKMGAADELTEQQARQLHFDLESSYNSFRAALPSAGT